MRPGGWQVPPEILEYGLPFLDRVHEDLSQLENEDNSQEVPASAGLYFHTRFQDFLETEAEPEVRQVIIASILFHIDEILVSF
jgi:hypothetical protein